MWLKTFVRLFDLGRYHNICITKRAGDGGLRREHGEDTLVLGTRKEGEETGWMGCGRAGWVRGHVRAGHLSTYCVLEARAAQLFPKPPSFLISHPHCTVGRSYCIAGAVLPLNPARRPRYCRLYPRAVDVRVEVQRSTSTCRPMCPSSAGRSPTAKPSPPATSMTGGCGIDRLGRNYAHILYVEERQFLPEYPTYLSDTYQIVNKHVLDLPHLRCHAGYMGVLPTGTAGAPRPRRHSPSSESLPKDGVEAAGCIQGGGFDFVSTSTNGLLWSYLTSGCQSPLVSYYLAFLRPSRRPSSLDLL